MDSPVPPTFKIETTSPTEPCPEAPFINNESDSCSEFDPSSPDSILDKSSKFGLLETSHLDKSWSSKSIDPIMDSQLPSKLMEIPVRNLFQFKKYASWDITLGDIVKEIFPHFHPVLASTIKEVLSENTSSSRCICMSSHNSSGVTTSTTSENFTFRGPHASPFIQLSYGVDEEAEAIKKILHNPWNADDPETIDLSTLKKDLGHLKTLEDKVQSIITDLDRVSQRRDQYHSFIQARRKAISIENNKNQTTTKLQKLFRIFIFSMLCIAVFVIVGMATFVVLELEFYGSHAASVHRGVRRSQHPKRNQFFLSSNFA